jgi:hypothetical protein
MVGQDELFRLVAAAKWALATNPQKYKPDLTYDTLHRNLYVDGVKVDDGEMYRYQELVTAYEDRFKMLDLFSTQGSSVSVEWLTHLKAYLDGMLKTWQDTGLKINLDKYPELGDLVQPMMDDFAEIQRKVDLAKNPPTLVDPYSYDDEDEQLAAG